MKPRAKPAVVVAATLATALCLATGASAHHVMGGATPATLMQGLLSGFSHPIIGLDHLAFIVGIGLLAAIAGYGMMLPALFVLAMTAGIGLHLAGLDLPYVELLIAASVVLIGIAVSRGRTGRGPWLEAGAFGLAGVLHGYALGETVIGAEATPLVAYIAGLAVTQLAIAYGAFLLGRQGAGAS